MAGVGQEGSVHASAVCGAVGVDVGVKTGVRVGVGAGVAVAVSTVGVGTTPQATNTKGMHTAAALTTPNTLPQYPTTQ